MKTREITNCPDCGAEPGETHGACGIERCRLCGGQAISCRCYSVESDDGDTRDMTPDEAKEVDEMVEKDGGRLPWDGEWPGVKECREFGLWCKWVAIESGAKRTGWVRCDADDPEATEDLNRLAMMPWDVKRGRRVRYH